MRFVRSAISVPSEPYVPSVTQLSVATIGATLARISSTVAIVQLGPCRKASSSTNVPPIRSASIRARVVLPDPLAEATIATRLIVRVSRRGDAMPFVYMIYAASTGVKLL
jgi:hypothetical protein